MQPDSEVSADGTSPSSETDAGQLLLGLSPLVIEHWERRVLGEIAAIRSQQRPIIVDTMPMVLDNLAHALSIAGGRSREAAIASTLPQEHGAERARLVTGYTAADVVREYQLLRAVVMEELRHAGRLLTFDETTALVSFFDEAVRVSLAAFLEAAEEAQRLFAAALTHDLRSPLGAAKMAAELIVQRTEDAAARSRYALRIIDNVERAERMVADLLDAYSLRTGRRLAVQLEPVALKPLLQRCIEEATLQHGARFVARIEHDDDVVGCWNASTLQRAVDNLLANAVKYGSKSEPITLHAYVAYERAIIRVHNAGNPIGAADLADIFQPFKRTSTAQAQGGWGIGLALVKGTAEAHGGSALVESSPQSGTTFTIDIPLDVRVAREPSAARHEP